MFSLKICYKYIDKSNAIFVVCLLESFYTFTIEVEEGVMCQENIVKYKVNK